MLVFSASYLSNNYKIMLNGIWLERFLIFKIVRFDCGLYGVMRGERVKSETVS